MSRPSDRTLASEDMTAHLLLIQLALEETTARLLAIRQALLDMTYLRAHPHLDPPGPDGAGPVHPSDPGWHT